MITVFINPLGPMWTKYVGVKPHTALRDGLVSLTLGPSTSVMSKRDAAELLLELGELIGPLLSDDFADAPAVEAVPVEAEVLPMRPPRGWRRILAPVTPDGVA